MRLALEESDDVGALRAAAERLRVVEVEQADDEGRVARVAGGGREADAFEGRADQLREALERFRARSAGECVLHRVILNVRGRCRARARRLSARSSSMRFRTVGTATRTSATVPPTQTAAPRTCRT